MDDAELCTFCLSGDTLIHQEIFTCETCNTTNESRGVQCFCAGCADVCHAGHLTRAIAFGQAYCDCGASNCQLKQETQTKMLASLNIDSQSGQSDEVAAAVKSLQYHGEERTSLSVARGRTPFSVHEVVPLAISASPAATDVFGTLRKECIAVLKESKETFWVGSDWRHSLEERQGKGAHAQGSLRKQSCCQLEDFALMIFQYHTQTLASEGVHVDPSTSGAEWWIQVKNSFDPSSSSSAEPSSLKKEGQVEDEVKSEDAQTESDQTICLHYDKDEDAAEKWAVGLFPPLSTVTYLSAPPTSSSSSPSSSAAAALLPQPTVVFNTTANDTVGTPICDAYLSFPRMGKHIAFDGSMLHGAPAHPSLCTWRQQGQQGGKVSTTSDVKDGGNTEDGDEGDSVLRVTFLVNIWLNHHPLGVKVLDPAIAKAVRASLDTPSGTDTLPPPPLPVPVPPSAPVAEMASLEVSFSPPTPPGADVNALSRPEEGSGGDQGRHDNALQIPLTTLLSLQAHGEDSTHTITLQSEKVFSEECPEDRDEDVTEQEMLLCAGFEQLCLPFISSKHSSVMLGGDGGDDGGGDDDRDEHQKEDEEEEEEVEEDEEDGLLVRMILPPHPLDVAQVPSKRTTAFLEEPPIDSFHFVYGDEMCAPSLEYEYDEDYENDEDEDDDEDDDDDDEDEDDDEEGSDCAA